MSHQNLQAMFDESIGKEGAELQVFVKGVGPMGPGPVTRHEGHPGVYTIVTMAQEGGPRGRTMKYPITFTFDDVVWFSTGPLEDDKPMITIASPGSINPGRVHG